MICKRPSGRWDRPIVEEGFGALLALMVRERSFGFTGRAVDRQIYRRCSGRCGSLPTLAVRAQPLAPQRRSGLLNGLGWVRLSFHPKCGSILMLDSKRLTVFHRQRQNAIVTVTETAECYRYCDSEDIDAKAVGVANVGCAAATLAANKVHRLTPPQRPSSRTAGHM